MKKMPKGMAKRLTLSSEKVRSLNDAKLLTPEQTRLVAGGQTPTYNCHGCNCSSWEC